MQQRFRLKIAPKWSVPFRFGQYLISTRNFLQDGLSNDDYMFGYQSGLEIKPSDRDKIEILGGFFDFQGGGAGDGRAHLIQELSCPEL